MNIMRRLMALAIVMGTAVQALGGQNPQPRALLVVVDDVHVDFRSTPRLRKLLQDLSDSGRQDDTWALVTTGSSRIRLEPTRGTAGLRAAVGRITGNSLKLRDQLDAFGDADRTAVVRRRASLSDVVIAQAIEGIADVAAVPPTILYLTDGYDARMVPVMSEVVRATAEARARLIAIWIPGAIPGREPPADVRPDEWRAYLEATRASLRTLAEKTGGLAVFSREELDAAFARLTRRTPPAPAQ
jgi:hypothetical protein